MKQLRWVKQYVKRLSHHDLRLLGLAPAVTLMLLGVCWTGILQPFEWAVFDFFIRLRPLEEPDPSIVIVTINEPDIAHAGSWPISDDILTDLLYILQQGNPRVIALDLYRDLPVPPGNERLEEAYRQFPNLIGIEKRFGQQHVPPPATLADNQRVALADLVEDRDGTVRRGLLSAQTEGGQIHLGLGVMSALQYLQAKGIHLEQGDSDNQLVLGQATFVPFRANAGGYVRADDYGYQILINFRGMDEAFQTISLTEVLAGRMPNHLVENRIVFIGSTAASINDSFMTPYSQQGNRFASRMPGVFIHANLASQIVHGAEQGRPFLNVVPEWLEWVWLLTWSVVGVGISYRRLLPGGVSIWHSQLGFIVLLVGAATALMTLSYGMLLYGIWVPVVAPILGLTTSAIAIMLMHNQALQRLAYVDELTRIANRRYFDQVLSRLVQVQGHLGLILADVDYFKKYNDTYGHQAGDACLQKVSDALRKVVRRTDLVARYGGEEFAIILPGTDPEAACHVAERIVRCIQALELPHESSEVSAHVSVSCGVVSVKVDTETLQNVQWSTSTFIEMADQALYQAKREGRNRTMMA